MSESGNACHLRVPLLRSFPALIPLLPSSFPAAARFRGGWGGGVPCGPTLPIQLYFSTAQRKASCSPGTSRAGEPGTDISQTCSAWSSRAQQQPTVTEPACSPFPRLGQGKLWEGRCSPKGTGPDAQDQSSARLEPGHGGAGAAPAGEPSVLLGVSMGHAAGSVLPRCLWDSSPRCLQPWAHTTFALHSAPIPGGSSAALEDPCSAGRQCEMPEVVAALCPCPGH